MSEEKVNGASLINGSSGSVNISNSNITIVAGGSSRDDNGGTPSAKSTESANDGSDSQFLQKLQLNEKEITWLQPKKFLFFHKKLINNSSNVFYGKQILFDRFRDVAVKRIVYSELAKNEVDFLLKAHHPNIVEIFDAGKYDSMGQWLYIVMELCAKTLRQYVKELGGKPVDMKAFVSIFNQLLNGLDYLQTKKILHRDIKPDNILVTESEEIKYSDFGISKQIALGRAEVTQTKYGAGSDGYRPPESYIENAKLTNSADIFSLALVVIHLISNGRHPFGSDPYDWRDNIRKNKNLDLSIIPQHIPPSKRAQLIDLVAAMLKSEPRERPSVKQIKSHDFFKDASSTRIKAAESSSNQEDAEANQKNVGEKDASSIRVKDDKAEKSSHNKQMDAEVNEKILEQKENSTKILQDSAQLSEKEFQTILQVVELQFAEGDGDSAIERVQDILSKESRSAMDAKNMADDLKGKGHYVQAMILYKISHDLHKKEGRFHLDDELTWIEGRIFDIYKVTRALVEADGTSRKVALNFAVKFLKQCLEEIREVKTASPVLRALVESVCLSRITVVHSLAGEFKQSIRFGNEGFKIMTHQFGENACNYRLYGDLLHNLGVAYHDSGRYLDAESCLIRAIEAKEKASDYKTESERADYIALSKRCLEKTRRMVANQR